jgi:hypothetical protein
MAGLLKVGAFLAEKTNPEAATAANVMSTIIGMVGGLKTTRGSPILGEIDDKSAELGAKLKAQYDEAGVALTQMGLMIVSDYGKLTATAPRVHTDWRLPPNNTSVQVALGKAGKQFAYENLMPVAWAQWDLPGGAVSYWYCTIKILRTTHQEHVFSGTPASSQFSPTTGFAPTGQPQVALRALSAHNTFPTRNPRPPPETLTGPLFKPLDLDPDTDNLGLYKLWFYKPFARRSPPVGRGSSCPI